MPSTSFNQGLNEKEGIEKDLVWLTKMTREIGTSCDSFESELAWFVFVQYFSWKHYCRTGLLYHHAQNIATQNKLANLMQSKFSAFANLDKQLNSFKF